MTEPLKKLAISSLKKDEGISPGTGTPFQQATNLPLQDEEERMRDEAMREGEEVRVYRDDDSEITQSGFPAPAPAPAPALGASPGTGTGAASGQRFQEESYPSTPAPYDPSSTVRHGGQDQWNSAHPENFKGEEEMTEEESEAFKALSGLFGSIVTKYAGTNPAATVAMRKEFDEVISQVFRPGAGTDNFVNLRGPGGKPAKIQAEGNDPKSSTNIRGRNPKIRESPETDSDFNPTSPGSGWTGDRNTGIANYGNTQVGSGISGRYPQPKPSRDPSVRASPGHPSGQMGYQTPSHPEASPGASGTYGRPTRVTTETGTQVGDFSKVFSGSGSVEKATSRPVRHGPGYQYGGNVSFAKTKDTGEFELPTLDGPRKADEDTHTIRKLLMNEDITKSAQDEASNPYGQLRDEIVQEEIRKNPNSPASALLKGFTRIRLDKTAHKDGEN